jgi:hypothetical protein
MTSAPSRRQPLSGNSYWLLLVILAGIFACAGPKKVVHKPPVNNVPPEKDDRVEVYDPVSGKMILVPRSSVKVDTVRWSQDTMSPILTDKTDPEPEKKGKYTLSLFMPFDVSESYDDDFDGKLNRFLHYYGGIQLAVEEIDSGSSVSINTFDVKSGFARTESLLSDPVVKKSDVIIGPYEKESIETVAAFGLKHEAMVISPWLPAFQVDEPNPNFIQINPGLGSHADAITSYIKSKWPNKKVYLVARDNQNEINRLNLFKKNRKLTPNDLIIHDDSPELARTDLKALLTDQGTIFILPYYAKADEQFVNSFLRKLHADKEDKEVIVFGLPQWMSFTTLNPNYMESLSVHISVSSFINVDHPDYMEFRKNFYDRFHTIPDLQAFLGYDLIKWLVTTMTKYGKDALISPSSMWFSGIASGFDIRPIYKSGVVLDQQELKTPLYYENTRIRILKYEGQDFHLAY